MARWAAARVGLHSKAGQQALSANPRIADSASRIQGRVDLTNRAPVEAALASRVWAEAAWASRVWVEADSATSQRAVSRASSAAVPMPSRIPDSRAEVPRAAERSLLGLPAPVTRNRSAPGTKRTTMTSGSLSELTWAPWVLRPLSRVCRKASIRTRAREISRPALGHQIQETRRTALARQTSRALASRAIPRARGKIRVGFRPQAEAASHHSDPMLNLQRMR